MTTQTTPNYLTVNQFVNQHPAFTLGGLRAWIFNSNTNGLKDSEAIVRIGRKVLIRQDLFFSWVESQNKVA